jgi:REP element-mobilizing transposase RayT
LSPAKNSYTIRGRKKQKSRNEHKEGTMDTAIPLAYLITFTCYGSTLHGQNAADHPHAPHFNVHFLPHQVTRSRASQLKLTEPAYFLDELRRFVVLNAIEEACDFYGWTLYAAHVRTYHVHSVIHALETPDKLMNLLKMNTSRRLKESNLDGMRLNRWTQHGRTKPLWQPIHVQDAIRFVVEEQGMPMAVCENPIPVFEQGESDAC